MAKREIFEITCDRCGKVETQGIEEHYNVRGCKSSDQKADLVKELTIDMPGVLTDKAVYEDLCKKCRVAVANYILRITKSDATPEGAVDV